MFDVTEVYVRVRINGFQDVQHNTAQHNATRPASTSSRKGGPAQRGAFGFWSLSGSSPARGANQGGVQGGVSARVDECE